jgi:hypothetical protein
MIREINSELTEQPYVNIIELVYMFIIVELHVAMSTIKLFDMESKTWNVRRLFWYTAIGMPSIFILGIFVLAAIKYLLQ